MQYEPEQKVRLYHVKTWQAPTPERKWGRHYVFGVIATSAPDAIGRVQRESPDSRIDAVNDGGVVHFEREEKTERA